MQQITVDPKTYKSWYSYEIQNGLRAYSTDLYVLEKGTRIGRIEVHGQNVMWFPFDKGYPVPTYVIHEAEQIMRVYTEKMVELERETRQWAETQRFVG